ncbi:hypothetical protein ACU6YS_02280 [Klebsiella aerogenes]
MSIFLHPRAAVATSGAELPAQAIVLSSLFAAGALLLSITQRGAGDDDKSVFM